MSADTTGSDYPGPAGEYGPLKAGPCGAAEVSRVYGCQSANGEQLHRYDTTMSESSRARLSEPDLSWR